MISVRRIETYSNHYQAARELRNKWLLRPIGLPDHSWEMHDEEAYHFVALDEGEVVGCVSLRALPEKPKVGQLMQMAVEGEMRGQGVGSEMMDFLTYFANAVGFNELFCHSREDAVGFYEKHGFVCSGEPFEEVGIPHRYMKLEL